MEADSTTFDSSPKEVNSGPSFPFPVSPGNYQLFTDITSGNGAKNLELQIVQKLQNLGLLPKSIKCPSGKPDCRVVCRNARVIDRVQWACEGCGVRQPIRQGTLFYKLQCSLLQALQMILAWSEDADCDVAAKHFGVKPRIANLIYNKMDDYAVQEQSQCKLGGEDSVVLAELYPDCDNRLSPDTTDQTHVHRVIMLADTNHIPTRYCLHVIKDENKRSSTSSNLNCEMLLSKVQALVSSTVLPNSLLVTGNSLPAIDGASTTQQLLLHCDSDMQHFLSSGIWRQAATLCQAARSLCAQPASPACAASPACPASPASAACAGVVQRYLHTALYRRAHAHLYAAIIARIAADTAATVGADTE